MRRAFRIVAAVLGIVTFGFTLSFAVFALHGRRGVGSTVSTSSRGARAGVLLGVSLLAWRAARGLRPFCVAVAAGRRHGDRGARRGRFRLRPVLIGPVPLILLLALHRERRAVFGFGGVAVAPPPWPRSPWCRP